MAIKDLTGKRFDRLRVIEFHCVKHRTAYWWCECSCDAKTLLSVSRVHLHNRHTRSCGCLRDDINRKRLTQHGHNPQSGATSTYMIWCGIHQRCTNTHSPVYGRYGGRGITVCKRWESFENFLADMGERPPGKTLDRRDNNKGYNPQNCRWATWKEQQRNRSNNHLLTFNNITKTLMEWSEITGIKHPTLLTRLNILGWSVEKALMTPLRGQGPKQPLPSALCHPERQHLAKGLCAACYMRQRRQEAHLPKKGEQLLLAI